jgi:hypothetical protein
MITVNIYPTHTPGMKYLVKVNREKWEVNFQRNDLVSRLRDDYPGCQIIQHNCELKR